MAPTVVRIVVVVRAQAWVLVGSTGLTQAIVLVSALACLFAPVAWLLLLFFAPVAWLLAWLL